MKHPAASRTCIVKLDGLDCVTFFESALGLARMVKLGGTTPAELAKQITLTRYRGGRLEGYLSRLHYTAEWILDNTAKATVQNLTNTLPGAERFVKKIDFMSTHPNSYRQLKADPSLLGALRKIEKRISGTELWHVPRDKVAVAEASLSTGDIVGITTPVPGLDCSHTGLCFRDASGDLRFLHASSAAKKVVLGPRLSEYVGSSPKNLGVMIARPLEPN